MNIYVLVEGERATKRVYQTWIPLINSQLRPINHLDELNTDNFFIFMGRGQTELLNSQIPNAVKDVNNLPFDRLVIAIDAEDDDYHDKQEQVRDKVDQVGCAVEVRYIIQDFCLETWFLGNRYYFRKTPDDPELISFRSIFNVRSQDPELLPENPEREWNRAQFAYYYLRAGFRDVTRGRQTYTKRNPGIVASEGYFNQVRKRCLTDKHIQSFTHFLNAFI